MIPILRDIEPHGNLSIFVTKEGKLGTGFSIKCCDLEIDDVDVYQKNLLSFLRAVSPNVLSRLRLDAHESHESFGHNARSESITELGYTKKNLKLFIEVENEPFLLKMLRSGLRDKTENPELKLLFETYDLAIQSGLKVHPLDSYEIQNEFLDSKTNWNKTANSLTNGMLHIGILRLNKPSFDQLTELSFAKSLRYLPRPFSISTSFKRLDSAKHKLDLERRLKQSSSNQSIGPETDILIESTKEALAKHLQEGAHFFEYEQLIIVSRRSQEALSRDLQVFKAELSNIGDYRVETVGLTPSFLASLLGNSQHVTLKEVDDCLTILSPFWHFGEEFEKNYESRVCTMHRIDGSIHQFDLFNSKFNVFNSVIIGTSGKGKSVLTGLLSHSLLSDPKIRIIKLDVGGSHSKECELFGGQEHVLQLGKPSGLNPFKDLNEPRISEPEKIAVAAKFLSQLILETGEGHLSKDLRSQIESSVANYLRVMQSPSLQEFYDLAKEFPRRNLLKRWVKGGLYENAFSSDVLTSAPSRLTYYNFSQVFQASDPEFAQAAVAAVLSEFNLQSLRNCSERIVLICDETPFFIKSCFDFFKLTTANVRKYGHAVILITQLSTDLVVGGDSGIIENSPQRFLFSIDGKTKDYKELFSLSDEQMRTISELLSVPGQFSDVYLQQGSAGRVLRVKVTPEEYWRLTTSAQDKLKMQKLLDAVPELKLQEAIKCLSHV